MNDGIARAEESTGHFDRKAGGSKRRVSPALFSLEGTNVPESHLMSRPFSAGVFKEIAAGIEERAADVYYGTRGHARRRDRWRDL
jgi:hypothetical protein